MFGIDKKYLITAAIAIAVVYASNNVSVVKKVIG